MKRKDWKIKNLKEGIFGRNRKFEYNRRIYFLRKLSLKKHKILLRKNLVPNYMFMNFLLDNFEKVKKNYLNKNFINNNNNKISNLLPDYLFRKKITNAHLRFLKLKKFFKFKSYFITNNLKNGFNVCILNLKDKNSFYNELLNEENTYLISYRYHEIEEYKYNFNFYFNFCIFLNINLEIYKILIYLNLHINI